MHAFNCIPHYDAHDDDDCNDGDDGLDNDNCYLLLMLMMAVMMAIEEDICFDNDDI